MIWEKFLSTSNSPIFIQKRKTFGLSPNEFWASLNVSIPKKFLVVSAPNLHNILHLKQKLGEHVIKRALLGH